MRMGPRRVMAALAFFSFPALSRAADVTSAVETLGRPLQKAAYANNVWDMQAFGGRIYLGHGNSSNVGPSGNAGPVPVVSYNPATGQFATEFTVDDEQIEPYRVINGQLYTPGHDPREDWSLGNYYRLESAGWRKYRNIPEGIHAYDIYGFQGRLFVGLGPGGTNASAFMMSTDNGLTWQKTPDTSFLRRYTFFELTGVLHVPDIRGGPLTAPVWYQYDGSLFTRRMDLTIGVVAPGLWTSTDSVGMKCVRPVNYDGAAVYIIGDFHNDHQVNPLAAFAARSLTAGSVDVRRIPLPAADKPWDLLARPDAAYLLASEKVEGTPDAFIVKVYRSADLATWTELFRFTRPTFARSFEEVGGDFYFGLGTDVGLSYVGSSYDIKSSYTDGLHPDAGTILRVRRSAYAPGDDTPPAAPAGFRRK